MRTEEKEVMMMKRLNLALPEKTLERIESVREATSATSNTEVIRNAILTYEALVEWLKEGADFYVKNSETDQYTPVKFMIDVGNYPPKTLGSGRT